MKKATTKKDATKTKALAAKVSTKKTVSPKTSSKTTAVKKPVAKKTAQKNTSKEDASNKALLGDKLKKFVMKSLEDDKAEDIIAIDLRGHSALADYMFIATGRSSRQVGAIAHHLIERFKAAGIKHIRHEGMAQGDWVILDTGDVIVHVFQPEVRTFYNIERIWSPEMLEDYSDTLKRVP